MYKSAVSEKQLFSWRSQDVLNQLLLEIELNTAKTQASPGYRW